ncbi:MAG: glycosyltransferase, partial [bacterium]
MRCRDVVEGLRAKGHQVRVLTSIYGTDATTVKEAHVERCLPHLWSGFGPLAGFGHQLQCELRSAYALKRALHEFKPQLISVWNMYLLSGALLTLVERASRPVVFHLDDDWMLKEDPWSQAWARHSGLLQRVVKSAVRPWVNHRIASVAASIIS